MTKARYAIYYTPEPRQPLWRFGSQVLGYDAAEGKALPQPALSCIDSTSFAKLTSTPRKYGFHATLKAPFYLASRWQLRNLEAALAAFTESASAPIIEGLELSRLDRCLALVPIGPTQLVSNYAQSIVEAFEPFRAELTEEERRRRHSAGLTNRQKDNLEQFGYPYVAEDYRFHMTLTGPVNDHVGETIELELRNIFRAHVPNLPVRLGRLSLVEQRNEAEPFKIIATYDHVR